MDRERQAFRDSDAANQDPPESLMRAARPADDGDNGRDITGCDAAGWCASRERRCAHHLRIEHSLGSQLAAAIRSLQQAAAEGGNPPLLIAIDQEEADVERLPGPPSLSPSQMVQTGKVSVSNQQGIATGRYLRGFRIKLRHRAVHRRAHFGGLVLYRRTNVLVQRRRGHQNQDRVRARTAVAGRRSGCGPVPRPWFGDSRHRRAA